MMLKAFQLLSSNTRAALLIVLATSFVAGTMILAKSLGTDRLGDGLHPLQISAGRFTFAWCALITVFAIRRPVIKSPNMKLHLSRSILGWGGVTLMFAAAALIPLSDATAISFLKSRLRHGAGNSISGRTYRALPLAGRCIGINRRDGFVTAINRINPIGWFTGLMRRRFDGRGTDCDENHYASGIWFSDFTAQQLDRNLYFPVCRILRMANAQQQSMDRVDCIGAVDGLRTDLLYHSNGHGRRQLCRTLLLYDAGFRGSL